MDLRIENMTCGGCARSVTKAIQSIDPAAKVETNPAIRSVKVERPRRRPLFCRFSKKPDSRQLRTDRERDHERISSNQRRIVSRHELLDIRMGGIWTRRAQS